MKAAYSAWPTSLPSGKSGPVDIPQPHWAEAGGPEPTPALLRDAGNALLLSAPAGIVLAITAALPPVSHWIACLIGAAGVGAAFLLLFRLRRAIRLARRRSRVNFERAGISMWLEDWSAVAQALMALRRAGVGDVRAHYAARPDEIRTLRRAVLIRDVNTFAVELMGVSDKSALVGSLDRILPDTDDTFLQWLVAFANGDRFYRSEAHITRPDGSYVDCLFTAALPTTIAGFADIIVTAIDVSEYRAAQSRFVAAEAEAARASRAATLGALTASITHEINSPLAAIVSNAEASIRWLRRPEPDLDEADSAITHVVADATRARDVVARLRTFLVSTPKPTTTIDLADTVRTALQIVSRDMRTNGVCVQFDADEALPPVLADSVQVQQIMINLVNNAADAMAGYPAPRDLMVTLAKVAEGVELEVSDKGAGIESEDLVRIFNPFFSTKPDGMGMGLAICRTYAEAFGGRIWATSFVGGGTTMHVLIPAMGDGR